MGRTYHKGDRIIYRKSKMSEHPGPRAQQVYPSSHGEQYAYLVDKFWTVVDIREDGTLVVTTRKGKLHELQPEDPLLRKAGWKDCLLHGRRFPSVK